MERVTLLKLSLGEAQRLVSRFLENDKQLTIDVYQYLEDNINNLLDYNNIWLCVCAALYMKQGESLLITE